MAQEEIPEENERPAGVNLAAGGAMVAIRSDEFPIHECVFRGDVKELSALIRKNQTDLSLRDPHGNTALHLAAMLGRRECVHLLCEKFPTPKKFPTQKNFQPKIFFSTQK